MTQEQFDALSIDAKLNELFAGIATLKNGVTIAAAQTVATVTDVTNAVKVQAGTGSGQLDFTAGVVKASLVQILGTALTETAGQIAAAFKKFFNVATPVLTCESVNQTGNLPTAAAVADAVMDELLDGHLTAGSAGAALSRIGSAEITVTAPVTSGGDIAIVAGDDYAGARALSFTPATTNWTGDNLNGLKGKFRLLRLADWMSDLDAAALEVEVTYAQTGSTVSTTATLTAAQTGALNPAPPADEYNYRWQLVVTVGTGPTAKQYTVAGATAEPDTGRCSVAKKIAAAS